MSLIQIVCANCGAKYRLPETFQSDSARCKACGATIDVAAQRSSAAAGTPPAAVPPTPAKPAAPAPKPVPVAKKPVAPAPVPVKPAGRASGRTGARAASRAEEAGAELAATRGRAGRAGAATRERGGRRRGGEEQAKGGKGLLIGGSIAAIAILAVGAWFVLRDDEQPAENQTAQTPAQPAAPDPAKLAADRAAAEAAAQAEQQKLAEAAAAKAEEERKAAEAAAQKQKPADATAPKAEEAMTADQVFDPKTLDELPLAEDVTEEEKTQMAEWIATADDGGLQWTRVKDDLAGMKYKAIAPIVNRLRTIDYFNRSDSMMAYELNQLLTNMLEGLNAGFEAVTLGEEPVEPKQADHNAKTVRVWQKAAQMYGSEEKFNEFLKQKRERRKEQDKGLSDR